MMCRIKCSCFAGADFDDGFKLPSELITRWTKKFKRKIIGSQAVFKL